MTFISWLKNTIGLQTNSQNEKFCQSKTIGKLQNLPVSDWGDEDIIKGVKFIATMQLRTPLRILRHHNELYEGNGSPPNYVNEPWEGVWVPVTKTFNELGLSIKELPEGKMASAIGPIPVSAGEFLKFLLAVRSIVEQDNSIDTRRTELLVELKKDKWKIFAKKLGGVKKISNNFFPQFVELLPGLSKEIISEFKAKKLYTPFRISTISDQELLKIKGIGQAKLKKIRQFCSAYTDNDEKFVNKVKT